MSCRDTTDEVVVVRTFSYMSAFSSLAVIRMSYDTVQGCKLSPPPPLCSFHYRPFPTPPPLHASGSSIIRCKLCTRWCATSTNASSWSAAHRHSKAASLRSHVPITLSHSMRLRPLIRRWLATIHCPQGNACVASAKDSYGTANSQTTKQYCVPYTTDDTKSVHTPPRTQRHTITPASGRYMTVSDTSRRLACCAARGVVSVVVS